MVGVHSTGVAAAEQVQRRVQQAGGARWGKPKRLGRASGKGCGRLQQRHPMLPHSQEGHDQKKVPCQPRQTHTVPALPSCPAAKPAIHPHLLGGGQAALQLRQERRPPAAALGSPLHHCSRSSRLPLCPPQQHGACQVHPTLTLLLPGRQREQRQGQPRLQLPLRVLQRAQQRAVGAVVTQQAQARLQMSLSLRMGGWVDRAWESFSCGTYRLQHLAV